MAERLAGKVAVITGAGSGIGAAMADLFCREGAKVVAADISGQQNDVASRLGKTCVPLQVDVTKSVQVQEMLQSAVSTFGRLDILCNNAGIDGHMAPAGEYPEEEFDKLWAINGRSVFIGMRYAIPLMLKAGGGSIVNTASIAAVVGCPTMVAYCAAKGAVLLMTKTVAAEYATQGIRVNAICPGPVATGLTRHMPKEYMDAVKNAAPMRRMADPLEIATLGVYLASDESSFMTGSEILIDGGYSAV